LAFHQRKFSDDDTEPVQDLPELKKGDELKIKEASVLEKKTKPPVLYTEAGLLSAMESAGKEIENEEERKALQNIGIGTPATRASIIETLFTRNYIQREKKSLIPTEKGLQVYELVKESQNCRRGNDCRMGIGIAENRKQRSGCRGISKGNGNLRLIYYQ
jgi:DNA topoisomerase-3